VQPGILICLVHDGLPPRSVFTSHSDQVIIPSGTSIAYKFSDLIWHGGTIIPDDEWDRLVVTGDIIGFTLADVGIPCTGAPATATYPVTQFQDEANLPWEENVTLCDIL